MSNLLEYFGSRLETLVSNNEVSIFSLKVEESVVETRNVGLKSEAKDSKCWQR